MKNDTMDRPRVEVRHVPWYDPFWPKRWKAPRGPWIFTVIGVVAGLLAGFAIGFVAGSTNTPEPVRVAVPGPVVTETVPGPVVTKTVPGPTVYVTVTPPPTTPPAAAPKPPKPKPAKASFDGNAGVLTVGQDIQPGTYRAKCVDEFGCYWARLRNFKGGLDSIIANGLAEKGQTATVTIQSSDKGFETGGFDIWRQQ